MSGSGVVVGALSFAAVLTYVLLESEEPAPGPLHPSHASVGELESCESCHSGDGDWADACGRCHAGVKTQIAERSGLHGLLGDDAAICVRCHVEHHGAAVPLVGPASFAAAGIASRADFDHEEHAGLQTGLHGRHESLECVACHANADAASLTWRRPRFLGAQSACTACHDDSHEGAYGPRCEGCHGQSEPFARAAAFEHSRFPLIDGHSHVECATCHTGDRRIASEGSRRDVRACAACHDDPHEAGPLVLARSGDCGRCHDTRAFALAEFDVAKHASIGVPLRGRHTDAPCAGCHSRDVIGNDLQACPACHGDVHAAGVLTPPAAESDASRLVWSASPNCAECHDEGGFRPALVGGAEHGRFGPTLAGAHVEAECAACHRSSRAPVATDACAECHDSPHRSSLVAGDACSHCHFAAAAAFAEAGASLAPERHTDLSLRAPHDQECAACHRPEGRFIERFPGRHADDCARCHDDPHAGEFESGAFAGSSCLQCHERERFTPSSFTPELHARTGSPLDGAHAAVPCLACHPESGARHRFDGAPTACGDCHDDPHGGTFERPGLPTEVDGRGGCARCHTTDGFGMAAGASFDHEFWTGRRLSGAHARAACGRCHGRSPDGSLGAAPSACAACHDDPHRGQFRRQNGTDCARCHQERGSFSELRFEHDRDTRFPLDTDHARLSCASCHRPLSLTRGQAVTIYRPLGISCRDCHATGSGADRRVPR